MKRCFPIFIAILLFSVRWSIAATAELPPDPGFEISIKASDVIVDCDILLGGPFRAIAQTRKAIKGGVPKVFELQGFNSFNWDTVHEGFATGTRYILFLSRTERPDVFAPLTPAAPRLSVLQDGVLLALGDPPFRIPVKHASFEEGLALLLEANASGKVPERAEKFVRGLFDEGDIEPRYFAVALAGALHDPHLAQLLTEASKDKLLKLRLTAIDALGKVGSAQTLGVLRGLLRDEKATVAREAARVLVAARDVDSLGDLLEWTRKTVAAQNKIGTPTKANDPNAAKAQTVASDILKFASESGLLLEADALAPALIEIAHSPNDALARQAMLALAVIAGPAQVGALLELADDRTFQHHSQAAAALELITLHSVRSVDEFREWWTKVGTGFGEDMKRNKIEAAATGIAKSDDLEERRNLADLIRAAPGEIALVSAAPILMKTEYADLFKSDSIGAWNTPLSAPFLIERMGWPAGYEQRDALDAFARLCEQHPRLREALWPLLRAEFADYDGHSRDTAAAAGGKLAQAGAAPALLDVLDHGSSFASQDACKSLYNFTARTFGLSINEPVPDQIVARAHFRGWWEKSAPNFKAIPVVAPKSAPRRSSDDAEQLAALGTKLEALVLGADSRRCGAAFAALYAERGPGDPFWKKLVAQPRQRDRAHGLLGLTGAESSAAAELNKRLSDDTEPEPPLCRAIAIVALGSLRGEGADAGGAKLAAWLSGAGAKAALPWRRLGTICLGLADKEPKSLEYLKTSLEAGLDARLPDLDEKPSDDLLLLRPTLLALAARSDSTELLMKALSDAPDFHARELAARALSLRRHRPALPTMLKALEKIDKYQVVSMCGVVSALLEPGDAPAVAALLDSEKLVARNAASYLLAQRPELGSDAAVRSALIGGLSDSSYWVRYYCAEALGKRRSVAALKNLVALLGDDDDEVRAGAAEAIGRIGDKDACMQAAIAASALLRADVRYLRAEAIADNQKQFEFLITLSNAAAYVDQRAGIEALGASPRDAALQQLLKIFHNDESPMQTLSATVLAQSAGEVVPALEDDLKSTDRNVRLHAVDLIGRIDSAAARTALSRIEKDDDPAVRALVEFFSKRNEKGER